MIFTKTIKIDAKSDQEAEEIKDAMSDIYDITKQKASSDAFLKMVAKLRLSPSKILGAKAYLRV